MKPKKETKWKKVEIGDPNLALEGLVAVEECLDYDFVNVSSEQKVGTKRKKTPTGGKTPKKKPKPASEPQNLSPSKSGASFTQEEEVDDSAWRSFVLPNDILKALLHQGFKEPTPIQALTLPAAILGRRDIVGAAETGSGKTLAFGLPILAGILEEKKKISDGTKPLFALILTPTRELAIQVKNHLVAAAKFTDINIAVLVGGMASVKQERILNKKPEIVVATPGRLWELVQQGNEHLSQVGSIKYLAIDETDRMLEKGHFEELHSLLERLSLNQTKRQTFVFSATLSLVHDLPKYLLKKSRIAKLTPQLKLKQIIDTLQIANPKIVDITQGVAVPESLTESRISCAFDEKDYYIYYFLQKHPGRTLIFCNSIGCVKRLANLLGILGCRPLPLHASMQQKQRLKNLERFRDDAKGVLVATDVAARGLDIPNVEHVLHYQIPRTSESYIHRSGRTARASNKGITVILMEPSEIKTYIKLCKTLEKSEDLPMFPVEEDFLKAVKQRVDLARNLDKIELDLRRENSEEGWLQKAAKEMDIIVDDFQKKYDSEESGSNKKAALSMRKQLNALLAKPIFPRGFSGKYPQHLDTFLLEKNPIQTVQTSNKKYPKLFKNKKNKST